MKKTVSIAGLTLVSGISMLGWSLPAASQGADPGATVFAENCAACHQAKGQGVTGVFPALAGSAFVKGDANAVIKVILAGRNGMPAFRNDLTDPQLANVVSFIRRNWGNAKPPVTPATVAQVRVKTNNQKGTGRTMNN